MTRMRVTALTSNSGERTAVAVLETIGGDRRLGLVVPMDEANRLARALGLAGCGCAPIYDLIGDLLGLLEAGVAGAVLDAHPGGIGAALTLVRSGAEIRIPCHPADALALAVRARAPIHVTDEALQSACPVWAHTEPGDPMAAGREADDADPEPERPRGDMAAHSDHCAHAHAANDADAGSRCAPDAPGGEALPADEVGRWLARVRPADFALGETQP